MSNNGFEVFVDELQLPIAPASITVKINNKNKVVTLLNSQELNLIRAPGLTDISMEILLPASEYPAVQVFQPQSVYLDKFEDLKKFDDKKKVFSLIINRTGVKAGLVDSAFQRVTLEDYKVQESPKEGLDLPVSLNFKQYIPPKVKKLKAEETKDGDIKITPSEVKTSDRPEAKTHTVKEGETLSTIVKEDLGYSSLSKVYEIADKNGISNLVNLEPGTVINFE